MNTTDQPVNRCFVDTNIWLYLFIASQSQAKSAAARAVLQTGEIVVSTQIINEVCVNLIKKAGFTEPDIQNLIESFYSRYRVIEISGEMLLKASQLRARHRFSFWDSLVVACALAAGATTLYSEDMDTSLVVEQRLGIINPLKSVSS